MGHLSGAHTKRRITSVEVVSDDNQQVLRFVTDDGTFKIEQRAATDSEWSFQPFASLAKEDAAIIATILKGGDVSYDGSAFDRAKSLVAPHSLPKPEEQKDPMGGDCTPLDIERAKAANLQEAKQLVQLEMERDHSLDRHVTGDVPGCPACDRKTVSPALSFPDPGPITSDDEPEDAPF